MSARSPRIAVLVGSLRRASLNRQLAHALVQRLGDRADCRFVEIGTLPHYDDDQEAEPAPTVRQFRAEVGAADALLFVTPEYNRSVPGVLKNAIDQGSRPKANNAWQGKPAGVIGASPGALGTCAAQQHLRNVLACLDVAVMGQPEAYLQLKPGAVLPDGSVPDQSLRDFLQLWSEAYLRWVARFRQPVSA
jgi:chromate reductase, NAD(P)H dehydrogenase (quinone)